MKYLKVWTSFRDVMKPLSEAEKGRLFEMMLVYAESFTEPADFAGNERFVWPAAKQWIDLTYSESLRLSENGKKGGRPKATQTKENQQKPTETNENQQEPTESHKVKESNIKEYKVKENTLVSPQKRFTPPTVDEVRSYCQQRKNQVDPERFVAFYSSKGWKVGNQPMKDWKAAVITWEKREDRPVRKVPAADFEQRDYTDVPDQILSELAADMEAFRKAGAG